MFVTVWTRWPSRPCTSGWMIMMMGARWCRVFRRGSHVAADDDGDDYSGSRAQCSVEVGRTWPASCRHDRDTAGVDQGGRARRLGNRSTVRRRHRWRPRLLAIQVRRRRQRSVPPPLTDQWATNRWISILQGDCWSGKSEKCQGILLLSGKWQWKILPRKMSCQWKFVHCLLLLWATSTFSSLFWDFAWLCLKDFFSVGWAWGKHPACKN